MAGILRVLPYARASGPWNMALDEAILEAVAAGKAPPTLRVYGWRGAWLSLGMAQPIEQVDRAACAAHGVGIVRRASGGTAVLHVDQVGWSLAVPEGHPLAIGDVVESYGAHAAVALDALRRLGIGGVRAAEVSEARAPLPEPLLSMACFGGLAPHEIVADDGRKLVGWGQVRRRGVVMHHAVLSLRHDATALAEILCVDRSRLAGALDKRVTDLHVVAGRRVGAEELARALAATYGGIHTQKGVQKCPGVQQRARELVRTKYGSEEWTARR